MTKIVVDAMGGDNAPEEIVKGAVQALKKRNNFSIIFTGDREKIEAELAKYKKCDRSRIEIIHCSEVIGMNDVPTSAIRTKKDSSLVVGMKLLKEREDIGAFVSAGSTGAVLTGGIMLLGRIKGVLRPALCPALPNYRGGRTLLCDCGANAECKPQYLEQFGIMASAYAKAAFGIENPRVGLVNNGTEEHKGDPLHQEAYALMKECKAINFAGNVEGRDIMYGDIDIAVTDGFSGNIALKAIEGCGKTVSAMLKSAIKSNPLNILGAAFMAGGLKKLKHTLDYQRFGGSVFLGLKKVVIKGHGSSKAKAVVPSILQAVDAVEGGLIPRLEKTFAELAAEAKTAEGKEEANA